jgi:hypothetical protein
LRRAFWTAIRWIPEPIQPPAAIRARSSGGPRNPPRRVQAPRLAPAAVPADIRLDWLHEVIQTSIGWTDTHLHVFSTRSGDYGIPDPELGYRNERTARLTQFLQQPGDRIHYSYDFGDGWEHDIVLEKRLNPEPGVQIPACLAGKGACPPEDCGGPWGYADLKEALADPRHEDHEGMLDWLGLDSVHGFDPAACDLAEINEALGLTVATRR